METLDLLQETLEINEPDVLDKVPIPAFLRRLLVKRKGIEKLKSEC